MRLKANQIAMVAAMLAAFSGCQSGPSWAWWNRNKTSDASVAARAAEPALPSAQTSPQAIAVAGLTPAAPPSSANLAAAAGAPTTPPNISIPLNSSTTVPNAPMPGYSPANSLADKLTSSPNAISKSAAAALPAGNLSMSPAGIPVSQPLAAVPATGPYDPKAYKPMSPAPNGVDTLSVASADSDRYGMGSADRFASSAQATTSPQMANAPNTHYGAPPPKTMPNSAIAPIAATSPASFDRYGNPLISPVASQTPFTPLSPAPTAPAAVTPPVPMSAANQASASSGVRLTTAAGQYRPGGTSTYASSAAIQPIEVATRPAPPAATIVAPSPTGLPGSPSEPWAPPASPAAASGTRTY